MYWNEYKTKTENINTANYYRYFLKLSFVGVNRLLVLTSSNQDGNGKRYKVRRYYLPEGIIKNYNVTINGKKFYDQPTDSDVKRYEEDYTTGCLLDYIIITSKIITY